MEKDEETAADTMKELLSAVEDIGSFRHAPLYEHMEFEEMRKEFIEELKENLEESFRDTWEKW